MGQDKVVQALIDLWRQTVEQHGDTPEQRTAFGNMLQGLAWKEPAYADRGGFKTAFYRNGLIVKFSHHPGDDDHTLHEWRIWRRASSYKRRFLARCFAYEEGLLIQKKWKQCHDGEGCRIARWYAIRFRIFDWGTNHAHRENGNPVFFDYDNNGYGWEAWKQRRGLLRYGDYARVEA